jgi:hypothetical protein
MTLERPTTGALQPGALVHEKGGGPTMHVTGLSVTQFDRFAHTVWRDETNEPVAGTFRADDLVVVLALEPRGDR